MVCGTKVRVLWAGYFPNGNKFMRAKDKESRRDGNEFCVLNLGFEPTGAHEAPAAQGFKNGEQSRHHKNQPQPEPVVHKNNARDEAKRADDPARHAAVMVDIGLEETAHGIKLA